MKKQFSLFFIILLFSCSRKTPVILYSGSVSIQKTKNGIMLQVPHILSESERSAIKDRRGIDVLSETRLILLDTLNFKLDTI